jgi:hypothetical protein
VPKYRCSSPSTIFVDHHCAMCRAAKPVGFQHQHSRFTTLAPLGPALSSRRTPPRSRAVGSASRRISGWTPALIKLSLMPPKNRKRIRLREWYNWLAVDDSPVG